MSPQIIVLRWGMCCNGALLDMINIPVSFSHTVVIRDKWVSALYDANATLLPLQRCITVQFPWFGPWQKSLCTDVVYSNGIMELLKWFIFHFVLFFYYVELCIITITQSLVLFIFLSNRNPLPKAIRGRALLWFSHYVKWSEISLTLWVVVLSENNENKTH